jgi:hypothetical protein
MKRPRRLLNREVEARSTAIPLNLMRPDAEVQVQLDLREIPTPEPFSAMPGAKAYLLGECSVLISREHGEWHLSIAHPTRYPTWDEIAQARYRLLPPEIWVALYLPPADQYVNFHRNCFQLHSCLSVKQSTKVQKAWRVVINTLRLLDKADDSHLQEIVEFMEETLA